MNKYSAIGCQWISPEGTTWQLKGFGPLGDTPLFARVVNEKSRHKYHTLGEGWKAVVDILNCLKEIRS